MQPSIAQVLMEDQGVRSSWAGLRMPVMTDYKPKWDLGDNPPIVYTLELLPDPLFRGDTPVPELLGILVPDHSQLCPSVGITLNELLCLMQHLFPGIQDMEIQRSNTLDSIWSISEEPPTSSPPLDCRSSCNHVERHPCPLPYPAGLASLQVYLFNHSPISLLHARYVSR